MSVQIIIIVHMVELCIVIFQFLYSCKIWKNTKQNSRIFIIQVNYYFFIHAYD